GCELPSGAAAAGGRSRAVTDASGRFSSGIREALSVANRRVLVIDDSEAIHRDFRKVLGGAESVEGQEVLDVLESEVFGARQDAQTPVFEIDSALQGEQGMLMAEAALREGRPYAVAFVDMRMPPGWDGLKTIEHLWKADPGIQVVICSAHSDYEWGDVMQRL